jgi:hypothetical protein
MWSTPIIEDVITSAVILALPTWLLIQEIVHCDANLRAASAKGRAQGHKRRGVGARWRVAGMVVLTAVAVAAGSAVPANALPRDDDDPPEDPPSLECLSNTTATLYASPPAITLDQSTTLHWSVHVPAGCGAVTQRINGLPVPRSGSRVEQPTSNTSWILFAASAGGSRNLATARVTVQVPDFVTVPPAAGGC